MSTPDLDIVGLGMSTLDLIMRLGDMPTWDRSQNFTDFHLDGGGKVATACVAAAKLGARAGYVGTVGNDLVGELKLRFLADHGVDLSRVVSVPAPEAQVVAVYVQEKTGERVFSALKSFYDTQLPLASLDRAYITAAKFLHLDGFYHDCALQAAQWMHEAGGQVCLDCGNTKASFVPAHTGELLAHVDILVCGSGFCRALTGEEDIWVAGPAVLGFGPQVVVETRGETGSLTCTREGQFHTPAFEVEVLDTTGAGDVFHGAYLVALLQGWDLPLAAQFAAAAAALKCSQLGGRRGIPDFDTTAEFLHSHGVEVP